MACPGWLRIWKESRIRNSGIKVTLQNRETVFCRVFFCPRLKNLSVKKQKYSQKINTRQFARHPSCYNSYYFEFDTQNGWKSQRP